MGEDGKLALQSRVRGDKAPHRWAMHMHVDGCHWYATVYSCQDCKATVGTYDERDLNEDPYSAMWMDEAAYEGEDDGCKRCAELRDGAEPIHQVDRMRL